MRDPDSAKRALERAERANDEIERSVWLAKAADYAITREAVLVGGAAVNLHTASYKPTDIDLCAYLDENDREELDGLGFEHIQGDHFMYTFRDGEKWPVEFPDSVVDGDVMRIALDGDEMLTVIDTESLVLDRIRQATDRTDVTFDEAVRLSRAVMETADWDIIESKVREEDRKAPRLHLLRTFEMIVTQAR